MKILCSVNQAECLRYGVDAPSSTVKIEVDPKSLTQEQRDFLADELYDGLKFPSHERFQICPPNYDGLMAAIDYGLERKSRVRDQYDPDTEEVKQARKELVSKAVQVSLNNIAKAVKETRGMDSSAGLEAAAQGLHKLFGTSKKA